MSAAALSQLDERPVIVITGASSGIGRETAIAFARRGPCRLVLVARRMQALEQTRDLTQAATGSDDIDVSLLAQDLASTDGAERLAAELGERFGPRLDVLVNNAGASTDRAFEDAGAVVNADAVLTLNLRTPIALTQLLLPALRQSRGTVVNVASVAGLVGTPDSPVYSATKWGLVGLSEALDTRLSREGVRVMCVLPGPVPTPGWPHERFAGRPIVGRVLATDTEAIARAIVRASERRGSPMKVRPRTYFLVHPLRAMTPWLLRRALPRARGNARSQSPDNSSMEQHPR